MKCTVCKEEAKVNLPRHNMKLCEKHFKAYILRQTSRVIKHFHMIERCDKILLALSGGKDSMGLAVILKELGYSFDAVHLIMPYGTYSKESKETVESFSQKMSIKTSFIDVEKFLGLDFFRALKVYRKPICSLCGKLKRYAMSMYANNNLYNTVVTGHNLDDETSFLLGNVLHWQTDYLERQSPILEKSNIMPKKVKPLVRITDEEMRYFSTLSDINFVKARCPHSKDAKSIFLKKILNDIDQYMPGTKSFFYLQYIDRIKDKFSQGAGAVPGECKICHYQTYGSDKCFLCNLKEKMG